MRDSEGFTKLCRLNDLKENEGRKFLIDETEIALFRTDNGVFALDNVCPHQHAAIIFDGFLENGCVVCPAHGWEFDLRTGCKKTGLRGLKSYAVRVENNFIYVKTDEADK
ncbi:MAG: Rieske 2Fe-2S domain-containing protein [Ignavibacteria bacterium]|jgi:NAD(P)H-dependent nitrite reductase small subunit|nr:Rieske 2Fe-2S domain-containing protein [Ignavibacteria bacterium]MCU7504823.1 Rieske 2Fe-2S domain-containing protein [Ignavibacteria bacterium]MCU7517709.1 Rieske 2Fe-2S domain-containing protein [Ignavibacteria bacterium]